MLFDDLTYSWTEIQRVGTSDERSYQCFGARKKTFKIERKVLQKK